MENSGRDSRPQQRENIPDANPSTDASNLAERDHKAYVEHVEALSKTYNAYEGLSIYLQDPSKSLAALKEPTPPFENYLSVLIAECVDESIEQHNFTIIRPGFDVEALRARLHGPSLRTVVRGSPGAPRASPG
jgi:hypothetical protein